MVLGSVYGELYRNAVVLKDRKGAERIRNEAAFIDVIEPSHAGA